MVMAGSRNPVIFIDKGGYSFYSFAFGGRLIKNPIAKINDKKHRKVIQE
jgi:hypothetical protein